MTRREIFDVLARAGVQIDGGMELRTDDAMERLFHHWIKEGSPAGVMIGIDGENHRWIVPRPTELGDFFLCEE